METHSNGGDVRWRQQLEAKVSFCGGDDAVEETFNAPAFSLTSIATTVTSFTCEDHQSCVHTCTSEQSSPCVSAVPLPPLCCRSCLLPRLQHQHTCAVTPRTHSVYPCAWLWPYVKAACARHPPPSSLSHSSTLAALQCLCRRHHIF